MQLVDMFFDEIEDAKTRKVPFIIPIGTIEYHAHHASCGTDTMVINGVMRELEKEKEIVVCRPSGTALRPMPSAARRPARFRSTKTHTPTIYIVSSSR